MNKLDDKINRVFLTILIILISWENIGISGTIFLLSSGLRILWIFLVFGGKFWVILMDSGASKKN